MTPSGVYLASCVYIKSSHSIKSDVMLFDQRVSGILLHPTSLPSRFGIGDLGEEAYGFVDFLVESFQQFWQILPLGPVGYGNSPYSCYSAFAGYSLLISLDRLAADGFLNPDDLAHLPEFPLEKVNYDWVDQVKTPLLRKANQQFQLQASDEQKQALQRFCQEHHWLDDYSLFMALKEEQGGIKWNYWPTEIATRQAAAMELARQRLASEIAYHQFVQYIFFQQWQDLRHYANEKGVKIIGDIPIYVAHDSVDVWANTRLFCLDQKTFEASTTAGVPPDCFSETGQHWGNPVYLWKRLEETNFKWWIQRIETMLDYVDVIRVDHFRAFDAFWGVKPGETTAVKGKWLKSPGEKLFQVLASELGEIPIIAEDLGVITPEVEALRDKFNFPGMKILQFAFDSDRGNAFIPYNYYNRNCIVYTGTHDNDTTLGWFQKRSHEEQTRVTDYLGCVCPDGIHWSLIKLGLSSVANVAIFPFQDILGLETWARMNIPGTATGNWIWRYHPDSLSTGLSDRLKYYTWLYGRAPH